MPGIPWIMAREIVPMAQRRCHEFGIVLMLFLFMIGIAAVDRCPAGVRMPGYRKTGLRKNKCRGYLLQQGITPR